MLLYEVGIYLSTFLLHFPMYCFFIHKKGKLPDDIIENIQFIYGVSV